MLYNILNFIETLHRIPPYPNSFIFEGFVKPQALKESSVIW